MSLAITNVGYKRPKLTYFLLNFVHKIFVCLFFQDIDVAIEWKRLLIGRFSQISKKSLRISLQEILGQKLFLLKTTTLC